MTLEAPQSKRHKRKSTASNSLSNLLLALAGAFCLIIVVLAAFMVTYDRHYDLERMLPAPNLRPASEEEIAGALRHNEVQYSLVRNYIWVATHDFVVRDMGPQTIIVPHGIRWLGGELHQTVLLIEAIPQTDTVPNEPSPTVISALLLHEWRCYGALIGATKPETCTKSMSAWRQVQAVALRTSIRPYKPEFDALRWGLEDPPSAYGMMVSTRDLYMTPLYKTTFDIILDKNHLLVGGTLGLSTVIPYDRFVARHTRFLALEDTFCQAVATESTGLNEAVHWPLHDSVPQDVLDQYDECKSEPMTDSRRSGIPRQEPAQPSSPR